MRRSRIDTLSFDLQPLHSANLNDLDLLLFERSYLPSAVASDILENNSRSLEEQLLALRFIDKERIPTVLGILVIGKEPLRFLPGAYIQFIRFRGNSLTEDIRDQKEISGPLPELLRRLDEIIDANISIAVNFIDHPTEIRQPDYPKAAIQQIIRNGVLHRTYEHTNMPVRFHWFSDRLEIYSPGSTYGVVNRENFGTPGVTDYRNPHIAEAMRNLGYVQKFGLGIQIAREHLKKNGHPPLEFDIQPSVILATIRGRN